jgi:preprotein translocase subunit YajC
LDILFAQGQATGGGFAMFIPMLVIFGIFYFLIIRPQSKQRKSHDTMLTELSKGDKVLTRGGIYGKVVDVQGKENNILILDCGNNTKLSVARSYVAGLADSVSDKPEG